MLHLRQVTLRRGPEPLVEDATVSVFRGQKIGVVGRNGCGKSTLLALIRGELAADSGELDLPANCVIASVAQEVPHSAQPVVDYVIDGDVELRAIEQRLAGARAAHDGLLEAALLAEFEHAGGYTARSRAAALLDGLGFDPADIDRPLLQFSGGLRMRASLARALMRRSDMLLLDEPTNHLDLDAVLWLEGWLRAYPGTLLLVSHDREFLDAIVGRVLNFEHRRLTAWNGNYTAFELQRAAARAQTAATAAKQRREAAHVRSFVERFRAKASKARQVQSRIKWLERLPQILELQEESGFSWEFAAPRKLPRPLLTLDGAAAGYGGRPVLAGVALTIQPDARIGVLGRNGAGKSTLMKLIAGELALTGGERTAAPDLETGFFAQLELEQLDATAHSLLELRRRGGPEVGGWTEQQCRDHLGRFGFGGERIFEPVSRFSGGERARLSLAILVARRPNLLLLDEPTNHLDFDMRESLLLALQDFAGAVVIVSHDRALLRAVCNEFLIVGDGRVAPFDGDLEDYARWLGRREVDRESQRPDAALAAADAAPDRRSGAGGATRERGAEARRRAAARRAELAPLREALRTTEARLAELGSERQRIEARLAEPDFYLIAAPAEQRDLPLRHGKLLQEITTLEEQWLELGSALEAAQTSAAGVVETAGEAALGADR
jgi:ATP-binding cassette subfamily F protein 3